MAPSSGAAGWHGQAEPPKAAELGRGRQPKRFATAKDRSSLRSDRSLTVPPMPCHPSRVTRPKTDFFGPPPGQNWMSILSLKKIRGWVLHPPGVWYMLGIDGGWVARSSGAAGWHGQAEPPKAAELDRATHTPPAGGRHDGNHIQASGEVGSLPSPAGETGGLDQAVHSHRSCPAGYSPAPWRTSLRGRHRDHRRRHWCRGNVTGDADSPSNDKTR